MLGYISKFNQVRLEHLEVGAMYATKGGMVRHGMNFLVLNVIIVF